MSAVQYGKWGVGGCVTWRPINKSLRAQPHTISISLCSAPAQSIALIFTYTEGKPTVLQLCCKTCVNSERWKGNFITDGCCVSWTSNSLLTFWHCFWFYIDVLGEIWHERMVNVIDGVLKSVLCIYTVQYLSFSPGELQNSLSTFSLLLECIWLLPINYYRR